MGIKSYFEQKRHAKARKRYTQGTPAVIEMGRTSGNPVWLFKTHPGTGESVISAVVKRGGVLTADAKGVEGETSEIPTLIEDLYFTRGFEDDSEYHLVDIHNFAFVARVIGRGIQVNGL